MKLNDVILAEAVVSARLETREQIENWLTKRGKRIGGQWTIDKDLKVSVDGDVDLSKLNFSILPVVFKKVTGQFIVRNTGLETLDGCPESVGTWFDCSYTNIKNLVGGPKVINASKSRDNEQYLAHNNQNLVSLEGVAKSAKELNIGFCKKLKELDYLPDDVESITAPASGLVTLRGIDRLAPNLKRLQVNANPIDECILGVLKIKNFKFNWLTYRTDKEITPLVKACRIIDDALVDGDILDAQSALIDAGLAHFAKF
jgi:hypothetical protein